MSLNLMERFRSICIVSFNPDIVQRQVVSEVSLISPPSLGRGFFKILIENLNGFVYVTAR